jgi:hypothetical protein
MEYNKSNESRNPFLFQFYYNGVKLFKLYSTSLTYVEDCLWDLSLGHRTGDGKFDSETFLGRLWMVFLWGGGEGEEETQGQVTSSMVVFLLDDASFQTAFFMLY